MKLQAKLVPLATACCLRYRALLGSHPPGHRTQPGPHLDATVALGPSLESHLWERRIRMIFAASAQPDVLPAKGLAQGTLNVTTPKY